MIAGEVELQRARVVVGASSYGYEDWKLANVAM